MKLISLSEYANQNKITYEAVRKLVTRYADELGEHIIRDDRRQLLDEEAVSFLDSKREKNPLAIIQIRKNEEIESLKKENETLLHNIALQNDIIKQQKYELQEADKALKKADMLLIRMKEDRERIEELEDENAVLRAETDMAKEIALEAHRNAEKADAKLLEAQKSFENEKTLLTGQLEQAKKKTEELEKQSFTDYLKGKFR